jgi:hypothetical protein
MQVKFVHIFLMCLLTGVSCRSKNDEKETKAHVTEPEAEKKEYLSKLRGDFFEPNHSTHKIVFNGNSLCLYHGNDRKDQYTIYRGEVTIVKDSVHIFFRGGDYPDINLKITREKGDSVYLRGKGKDLKGRNVNYVFAGTE